MDTEKQNFSSRDIYLAATLITMGYEMINISYQIEGSKEVGYFEFEMTEDLDSAIKKFWAGKITIEPRAFVANIRSLKSQCMNTYKNPFTNTK